MKKVIAISLLLIHAFNIAGYSAVFNIMQQKASDSVVEKLDKGSYNDNELVEVKVLLSMPYATERKDYERYDGELEISGIIYNYVKRKFYNDTLYLMCIPNHEKTTLAAAKIGYTQVVNDFAGASQGKKSQPVSSNIKSGLNEYNQSNTFANVTGSLYLLLDKTYPSIDLKPVLRSVPVQLQPPNFSRA